MKVRAVCWEKFSPKAIEEEGFPKDPVVISKSSILEKSEAISYVNSAIENMLQKGWKLKRGPEGKLSLYLEESTSLTDYHSWYTLEKVEEESN